MNYTRFCMPVTLYSLFLYILSCDEESLERTFFLFNDRMPSSVITKIKNSFILKVNGCSGSAFHRYLCEFAYLRYVKWFKLPNLKKLRLYVADHKKYCTFIIGKKNYTLLEDAPHSNVYFEGGVFEKYDETRCMMKHYKIITWFYGPIYGHSLGKNKQCTDLLMWKKDDTPFIRSKKCHVVDLKRIWNSCEYKRKRILSLLDFSEDDLHVFRNYPYILLTQPFYNEPGFDDFKHECIYRLIAEKYPKEKILIKTHPRDKFDYERFLPGYKVYRNPIPLQLLDIMGAKWERAITVNSSAVYDFEYPIEIDWYGDTINVLSNNKLSRIDPPKGANICSLYK